MTKALIDFNNWLQYGSHNSIRVSPKDFHNTISLKSIRDYILEIEDLPYPPAIQSLMEIEDKYFSAWAIKLNIYGKTLRNY